MTSFEKEIVEAHGIDELSPHVQREREYRSGRRGVRDIRNEEMPAPVTVRCLIVQRLSSRRYNRDVHYQIVVLRGTVERDGNLDRSVDDCGVGL